MIKLYNSLTRTKEEFKPILENQVKMYVCGPTVYDAPHIGHARSAYIFDLIRRYLTFRGYKVKFIKNVTDVDDKIIDKAKKEFPQEDLNISFKKVSKMYLDAYHLALSNLGIDLNGIDLVEPRASEYIPKMIDFIKLLIEEKSAYEADGSVYFDIKKAKDYGRLSNQSLSKMESGARVQLGENKKDPLDFALWKRAKENEPSWESPWGRGRPGWHIECSAMSVDLLGDEFDIHGGGIDLIFPHHENELAQSEAAGKKFARYWIHHGLLTINGQKMSKSLGNFITVDDFIIKHKDTDLLKLLFLSTHYSHPVDFNQDKIDEARKQKKTFDNFFDKINFWRLKEVRSVSALDEKDKTRIDDLSKRFFEVMDDDFNTPRALAVIFELIDLSSKFISQDRDAAFKYAGLKVEDFFKIFILEVKPKKELSKEFDMKLKLREEAKKNKDFNKADTIRKEIEKEFGGALVDTASGFTFIEG